MRTRTGLLMAKRFAIFFGLWLVLTDADEGAAPIGLATAAGALWISTRLAPTRERPLRLLQLAAMAPGFFWRSLRGGADVAWRAFHPKLPLAPGWIAYPARLPSGTPRVMLGGEVSLLPGTLVAGEESGRLLVHCLDTGLPIVRQIEEEEARLARAVGA